MKRNFEKPTLEIYELTATVFASHGWDELDPNGDGSETDWSEGDD